MRVRPLFLSALLLTSCHHHGHGVCGTPSKDSTPSLEPSTGETRDPFTPEQLFATVGYSEIFVAPDGKELAFTSDKSGAYEVWTAPIVDGVVGAAVQRTHQNEKASSIRYSPDGASLVFANDQGGNERNDLFLLSRDAKEPVRIAETKTSESDPRFSPDGKSLAYVADRDRDFRFNVEVMDLATKKTRQLTHETVNVYFPRWSPDGKTLSALRTPDDQKGDLLLIDVATAKVRVIAPPQAQGILAAQGFLADGRVVAIATNAQGFRQMAIVDPASGKTELAGPADWDVENARVLDDGTVLFLRNVHGESELMVTPGPKPFVIPPRVIAKGGILEDWTVDRAGQSAWALRQTSSRPTEIVSIAPQGASVKLAVRADLPGVDLDKLAQAERREVKSFDGTPIDVFVWWPRVRRMGVVPPLVIWVHGGPDEQFRGAFNPLIQSLVEAGIAVAAPNYRGSSGYGQKFLDLNNGDWGGGDLKDLLAVVNSLRAEGRIDRSRVGIMGGSYGGYLTLRAITAAPGEFQAAVDLYGMPDLVEDYKLTEDRFGTWYETEMGTPEKNPELFRDRSPIHFLDAIKAPLLVLQGENDANVPRKESDGIVDALKKRNQPVEYTVYPNEGHGFTHRENRLDACKKSVDFFQRHLRVSLRGT